MVEKAIVDVMTPTVSVVLCTFNGAKYLPEQIESLIAQSYPIFEIIAQDDGSADETWTILLHYQQSYPQLFKVFKNSSNLGWNQNFYSAILKATGDLIVLCDQDDVWLPDRIQSQVDSIGDNLIDVCSSWYWKNSLSMTPRFSESGSLGQIVFFPLHCGHQMMMTKRIKEYIPIGIHADMAHDRFLSIVGIYLGNLHASRELLVKWRRHGDNTTGELVTDKNVSGIFKIKHCIKSLLLRKKSPVISRGCNKYYEVLNELNRYSGVNPKGEKMARLMRLLRDQSLFSYMRASLIVVAEREEIFHKCRTGIKDLYSDLTFVYRYWFEHQYDI